MQQRLKKTVYVVLEQREMKEAERLQILGKMSAVIAHEIRNPLAGITAVTQVLEGKLDRDDPRRQYVSLILKEIDRVNKLVHDLLDYTRETKPYFLVTCPSSIINRALTSFSNDLKQKNIEFIKDDFDKDKDYLKAIIKGYIARVFYGDEGYLLATLPIDKQIGKALSLFSESEKIAREN